MTRTLNTVSKLLAKAENAGTPEEAEAFMAKVQEMASANGIDLAVARLHQAKKERVQVPEERKIVVNPWERRHNRKHFMELAMAIADVNDVEYLIGGRERSLFAVGFPSDLDVVEALFAHLSAQMAIECDEALARGDHKEERQVLVTKKVEIPWEDRAWGGWNGKQYYDDNPDDGAYWSGRAESIRIAREAYLDDVRNGRQIFTSNGRNWEGGYRKPVPPPAYEDVPEYDEMGLEQFETKTVSRVDGRVFRGEFYGAFVRRMKARLWEIRRAVERDRGVDVAKDSDSAIALRDKKAEVDEAHEEQRAKVVHLGTYRGSDSDDHRRRDRSGVAHESGRRSAESVPIDSGREVK